MVRSIEDFRDLNKTDQGKFLANWIENEIGEQVNFIEGNSDGKFFYNSKLDNYDIDSLKKIGLPITKQNSNNFYIDVYSKGLPSNLFESKVENPSKVYRAVFVNESNDLFKPKSAEEISNLKDRGYLNQGGKWKFNLNFSDIYDRYNENGNVDEFTKSMIKKLESYDLEDISKVLIHKKYYSEDDALTTIMELENIIDEFKMIQNDDDAEAVDYVLEMLSDWGDYNNIFIDFHGLSE